MINVSALEKYGHLRHHLPLAKLVGYETRHALVRKVFRNDLNFSTPTKPELTSSCLPTGNRESGVWFEVASKGCKYLFEESEQLIQAIEEGVILGQCPALNKTRRLKF